MNQSSSAYEVIASHNKDVQVRLYTPAHQGVVHDGASLHEDIYQYDVPFLTRPRTQEVENYFSQLYGTKHTFWLTGGGTQGVLTACALLGTQYGRVAIALNSHISTINGIILAGLEPYFIPSQSLMPTTEEVIAALATGDVPALLLTHPSYEGVTIDLARVADYCRQHDIALAVDEAHGSHFPFMDDQWQSAIATHADIVTHSMHKYTGSLVQTALLHLPMGSRFAIEQVMGVMTLFEATTRSNVLILSIEDAIKRGFSEKGRQQFLQAIGECEQLRSQLDRYGTVLSYDAQVSDPLKIVLKSDRLLGTELADLLYEHGIDGEFADEEGVLLIFSFSHTHENFRFMQKALEAIASSLNQKMTRATSSGRSFSRCPQIKISPKVAFFKAKEKLPLKQCIGRISSCCIKKVPPGSPLLIPGEEVTDWHLKHLSADTMVEVVKE